MKHGNTHYAEVSRDIWGRDVSDNAILLFYWLNELEQRFTGKGVDWFYRTNTDLMSDLKWSEKKLKIAKSELLKQTDLIESWQTHFIDPKTGKKSEKHFTAYRILK